MAATAHLDTRSREFVTEVVEAIDAHVPVLEAFLLGSGAVGPFDPQTSDIDLVVVVERQLGVERAAVVEEVGRIECPARDLELVVYVRGEQPPAFELNVNEGVERPDEEGFWFVLDAAVAQEHAVPVWDDRAWDEFFEPVGRDAVVRAMRESLAWSERQPPGDEFARLNAIRARHYLEHGEWISKAEAAR